MLSNNPVIIDFYWFGKASKALVNNVVPLFANESRTDWTVIDLGIDPECFVGLSEEQLFETLLPGGKLKPIRHIKTNAMPSVLPGDHELALEHLKSDLITLVERAEAIRADQNFVERVKAAQRLYRESFDSSDLVEEQLYQPPFFPVDAEMAIIERFHRALPTEKYDIVRQFKDSRSKTIGQRLVLSEWPQVASQSDRDAYNRFIHDRLLIAEHGSKWMTVTEAMREIAEIRGERDKNAIKIADGYLCYLRNRFPQAVAAE